MSTVALAWVCNVARPHDHAEFRLLTLLAEVASPDGTGAYPSQATLAEGMMRSARMVRRGLDALLTKGFIRRGDQSRAAHLPRDQRPVVYDLVMDRSLSEPPLEKAPRKARPAPKHWQGEAEPEAAATTEMSTGDTAPLGMPCPQDALTSGHTVSTPPGHTVSTPETSPPDTPCPEGDPKSRSHRVLQTSYITTKQRTPQTPQPDPEPVAEVLPAIQAAPPTTDLDTVVQPTDRIAAAKAIVEQYRTSPMCPSGKLPTSTRAGITNATLELLKDGYTIRQLADGITAWSKAGMVSPTQIANFVNRAANTPTDDFAHLPPASAKAAGWLQSGERLAARPDRRLSQSEIDQRDFAAASRKELV